MSKKYLTEEQLVDALKQGDLTAIAYIYQNYSDSIYGVLLRILKDPELSNDAFQEVVFKIWNTISSYDTSRGRLFTWMINIARNYAIDRLRSRQVKKSEKNNRLDDCFHEVDHHHQIHNNVDLIGIRNLVRGLKPELRSAIDVVYFKGFSQRDAAIFLGVPLGTLKSRIRTAILVLKKSYTYECRSMLSD